MKLPKRNFTLNDFGELSVPGRADHYLDDIKDAINSRIDSDVAVVVKTPSTVGNEFRVLHKLGYVPIYFLLIYKTGAVDVYPSGTAWTNDFAFFKATVADITVKILVW